MKNKIIKIIIFLSFTIIITPIFADDKNNSKEQNDTKKTETEKQVKDNQKLEDTTKDIEKEEEKTAKDEELESEYEKRQNVILYGLEDDILELLGKLKEDEDERFDTDLATVFNETKIPKLKQKLFQYFAEKENPCLKDAAIKILESRYDYNKDTVSAAILYSRDLKIQETKKVFRDILEEEDTEYIEMAISALGKLGDSDDAVFLSEMFEANYYDDDKKSLIVQQSIAGALEELHAESTWDFLVEIASDSEENATIRGRMATALGKIGNEKAVPILCKLFEEKDPILRTAAIKGLASFKTKEASKVLLQAFKDSYYKVRLQAIKSAKEEKRSDAIPYILYRAKKDPVNNVKYKAIEALSEFKDEKSDKWMIKSFKNSKTKQSIRLKIAYYMLKNNFEAIYPSVKEKTLAALSDDKKKRAASELGKILSKIKNPATEELAVAFLNHKDVFVKSIGLDMFKKNEYTALVPLIQKLTKDEKHSALSRRAKRLLEKAGFNKKENKEERLIAIRKKLQKVTKSIRMNQITKVKKIMKKTN